MKKMFAGFFLVFAVWLSSTTARAEEGGLFHAKGVFCHHLDGVRLVFREWKNNHVPTAVTITALNKDEAVVECVSVDRTEIVFDDVTLLYNINESLEGKPMYFYEGRAVGARTSSGVSILSLKPGLLYFFSNKYYSFEGIKAQM